MKRFLYHCFLTLIPLFALWIAAEIFYRVTENNYSYKHQQIERCKLDVHTLILGDSHTFFGIRPEFMRNPAFNLSGISQSLYFDELLLKKYLNQTPQLKKVVLMVNYTTLSKQDDTAEDTWRKYFYDQHMNLEVPIVSCFDVKRYSLALTRRTSRTLKTYKKFLSEGTLVGVDSLGWGTYYTADKSLDIVKTAKIVTKRHEDGLLDFSLNKARLKRMIKWCAEKNIEVVVVSMPVTAAYRKRINNEKWLKSVKVTSQIAAAYQEVTYYNFFASKEFNDADFYDANHLNSRGAAKFTLLLDGLINQ